MKTFLRPRRQSRRDEPIPFAVTCQGYDLQWPAGGPQAAHEALQDALPAAEQEEVCLRLISDIDECKEYQTTDAPPVPKHPRLFGSVEKCELYEQHMGDVIDTTLDYGASAQEDEHGFLVTPDEFHAAHEARIIALDALTAYIDLRTRRMIARAVKNASKTTRRKR